MNIYQKIAEVMKDVQYLCKDDHVKFGQQDYKAISEEKVTSTVRESLIKNGIVIVPIEQEHKRDGTITTVDVAYRIQNIENVDDFVVAKSSGTGADTQDKGVGKAMTYSYKYLLLRTFAIPTGDDPDKISSAEIDAKDLRALQKKQEQQKVQTPKADTPAKSDKPISIEQAKELQTMCREKWGVEGDAEKNFEMLTGYAKFLRVKNSEYDEIVNKIQLAK